MEFKIYNFSLNSSSILNSAFVVDVPWENSTISLLKTCPWENIKRELEYLLTTFQYKKIGIEPNLI